jgi:hypothetical protein
MLPVYQTRPKFPNNGMSLRGRFLPEAISKWVYEFPYYETTSNSNLEIASSRAPDRIANHSVSCALIAMT